MAEMRKRNNNLVNNLQLVVFTITYLLSWVLVYGLFLFFTPHATLLLHVMATLGLLILGVTFWAYLFVLFRIPHEMAHQFDELKNRISTGEIASTTDFSRELTGFMPRFFNYAFCDVDHAAVKAGKSNLHFSGEALEKLLDWKQVEKSAAGSEALLRHGRVRIDRFTYFAYTVPIWFDHSYIGFFTIFARQRQGRVRLKFFTDLEEHFIDDQLVRLTLLEQTKKKK